jgi:uncharacterized membrane protein YdbT with pleckstrin-like domain
MLTFTASRLTSGNRIFPNQILIDELGITFKIPGIFSGEEKTIPFTRISSVDIICPLIGFSTIKIETTGEGEILANGFTQDEVTQMKKVILEKLK